MSSRCQHTPYEDKLKICVWNFLPATWRQGNVTVQNRQMYRTDEQFLCPLPCATGNEIAVGHITHVMVTISHIEWFIHDRNFLLLVQGAVLPSSHTCSILERHPISVPVSWALGPGTCPTYLVWSDSLSTYNLRPCTSTSLVSYVTVACASVKCCALCCTSCPTHTFMW